MNVIILIKDFLHTINLKDHYIILKWAESKDGFIGPIKSQREVFRISGDQFTKIISHLEKRRRFNFGWCSNHNRRQPSAYY